jgi:hypothetical protein
MPLHGDVICLQCPKAISTTQNTNYKVVTKSELGNANRESFWLLAILGKPEALPEGVTKLQLCNQKSFRLWLLKT